jgi:exodeoxyribonuclease VII large subunit
VLIIPARVQGEGAAAEIAAGIATANRLAGTNQAVDVLVVGRGGGSLEDLWAFNEEIVVRAIAASQIPVVSAVGHEIDVTLSDLAADVRALTPSEAAERIVPAADEVQAALRVRQQRLINALRRRAAEARRKIEQLAGHRAFRRPFERVLACARELDTIESRVARAIRHRLTGSQQLLAAIAAQLESLSPLGILGRGYSLTTRLDDGRLVTDAALLEHGDTIRTRFARGQAVSRVEQVQQDQTS